MVSRVKWGDVFSDEFLVPLGTKQCGISSPGSFAVFIDDLLSILRRKGFGCHLIDKFVACVLFADDLALMAPTRHALQLMINVCKDYCDKYCLAFNTKMSKVVVFGKSHGDACSPLTIGKENIEFVSKWKNTFYLGKARYCLIF